MSATYITAALLLVLSVASLSYVNWLLSLPYRPGQVLMPVADLIEPSVPDATPDWIGMV